MCKKIKKEHVVQVQLYKTLVRYKLKCCIKAWNPYVKRDIGELEKVQKRVTQMITGCPIL